MINYGKIRKTNKINDLKWEHTTEYFYDGQLDHSIVEIEEHRKTSINSILSDLVDVASMAKNSPITIEIRHDHGKCPKLIVLYYRKKI